MPVLDVASEIEEAEEDVRGCSVRPAPLDLGPKQQTTNNFAWSGGFGQSSRSSSAAGGYLDF